MQAQYFKALKDTHRFRKNQKVWIRYAYANHLEIRHRWRGRGGYINGIIDRFHNAVGEIKTIEVDEDFGILKEIADAAN